MTALSAAKGWRYGLLGLPLAFVALPLYVILPNHYAIAFGVPLASMGAVLLGARLFDAAIDPLLGRWIDRLFHNADHVLRLGGAASALLALGFALLFFPPVRGEALLLWALALLVITYAAFSAVSVAHQSWGARLGGDEAQRSRIVAWREGLGLVGVLLAAVLPLVAGLAVSTAFFALGLALGCWAWAGAPRPDAGTSAAPGAGKRSVLLPFQRRDFRRLLLVFMFNGIASAAPATLVLFFVQDMLQAPKQMEAVFLGAYFAAGALSIPLWLRAVRRWGLAGVWLTGMLLAVAVFGWASQLGAGDVWAFGLVSALSGVALGADLIVPGALLTGVIQRAGDAGRSEGAYFGWWNFATKLNLALAAGLSLPLLQAFGYAPGARDPAALRALVVAYCVLPCALKLIAGYVLFSWAFKGKPS